MSQVEIVSLHSFSARHVDSPIIKMADNIAYIVNDEDLNSYTIKNFVVIHVFRKNKY